MSQIAHAHAFQSTIPALAKLDNFIYKLLCLRMSQTTALNTAAWIKISDEHEAIENEIRERWPIVLNEARIEVERISRRNPGRILPADFEPLLDRFSEHFRQLFNNNFGPRGSIEMPLFESVRSDINELVRLKEKAHRFVLIETETTPGKCYHLGASLAEEIDAFRRVIAEVYQQAEIPDPSNIDPEQWKENALINLEQAYEEVSGELGEYPAGQWPHPDGFSSEDFHKRVADISHYTRELIHVTCLKPHWGKPACEWEQRANRDSVGDLKTACKTLERYAYILVHSDGTEGQGGSFSGESVLEYRPLSVAKTPASIDGIGGGDSRNELKTTRDNLGEAKKAVLKILHENKKPMLNKHVALKAGYAEGTLRHHYAELTRAGYVTKTKAGYSITPIGIAVLTCDSV